MKNSESYASRKRITLYNRLVFALFIIKIRIRFKRTLFVFNDMTGTKSGLQRIPKDQPIYWSERYIQIAGIPLYDLEKKIWVKRLRGGSVITTELLEHKGVHFNVENVHEDYVVVQSKKNTNIFLWIKLENISSFISE